MLSQRLSKILLMLILLFPLNLNAETLWIENFEANNEGVLTGVDETNGTISISSTQASTGTYSLKLDLTGEGGYVNAYREFIYVDLGVDFYCKIRFFPDSTFCTNLVNGDYMQFLTGVDSGYNSQWSIYLEEGAGGNQIYITWDDNDSSENATSSTGIWNDTDWNTLEVYYNYDNSAGIMTVWLNGVQVLNETAKDTGTANTGIIYFGYYDSSGVTGVVYVDDIVIDSSNYIGTGHRIQEGVAVGSLPYF